MPRQPKDRELLLWDMAAFLRELCERHDRYVASGKVVSARTTTEYERAVQLLERVEKL